MSIYLENLKKIFGTKNNIQSLRNKILELAFEGKLSKPMIDDEPVELLINRIELEKMYLKEKGVYQESKCKKIGFNFNSLVFPQFWECIKLGEVVRLYKDKTVNGEMLPYLDVKYLRGHKEPVMKSSGQLVESNEYAMLVDGENSGEIFEISEPGYLGSTLMLLNFSNEINLKFIKYFIQMNHKKLKGTKTGIAIPHLNKNLFNQIKFPLPSINEQQRIVAKIESIMAEIDKLEELLQKKDCLLNLLPKAVVNDINECCNDEELKGKLKFIIENFKTVFQTPDSLQDLRNIILQLAIEGKLVKQNPDDQPASELIKQIAAEKDKLVKEGKIKKEKPLAEISEDEIPFKIPGSWEWVRLGEIINYKNGYSFKSSDFLSLGVGVVRIGDIVNGSIKEDKMVYVSECENINQNYYVEPNDLLIAMSGATTGKLGFNTNNKRYYLNQRVGKIEPIICHRKYIFYVLSTKIEENLYKSIGSAIPNLSTEQINDIIVPLPPLEEQIRIVSKIEAIMSVIYQLESKMNRRDKYMEKIAVV